MPCVEVGGGVGERRYDDGESARNPPPPAFGADSCEHPDAHETHGHSHQPPAAHTFARVETDGEQHHEDRHGRVGDGGHARVDVLLAPRDQDERNRHVGDAEDEGAGSRGADLGDRLARAEPQNEEGDEHSCRKKSCRSIIAVGSISSTATLMKRYDAPQIPATMRRSGT